VSPEAADAASDVATLAATAMTRGFADRQLSPVQVAQAVLDRIERLDPVLNAFCLVDRPAAIEQARASERRWSARTPLGPLDGVPLSVKDLLPVQGWPTRRGSRATSDEPARQDAPSVAKLRAAGAVLVGKTTTAEFGWKPLSDCPLTGTTRNPWDLTRTSGGSSGGSGAAVAAGLGPLSLGTDAAGSVRIPAAFCGLVAIKATRGSVPAATSPFGLVAQTGPMTRNLLDAATALAVLTGDDGLMEAVRDACPADVEDLRVALCTRMGHPLPIDPEVEGSVRAAADSLDALGAHVSEVDPPSGDLIEDLTVLWSVALATMVEGWPRGRLALLEPGLQDQVERGRSVPGTRLLRAQMAADAARLRLDEFFGSVDVLLTPTVPVPAFSLGADVPPSWPHSTWTSWTPFTFPFNLSGHPAISLPCGVTQGGLPVGLQLVACRHADAQLLRWGAAFDLTQPGRSIPEPDVGRLRRV